MNYIEAFGIVIPVITTIIFFFTSRKQPNANSVQTRGALMRALEDLQRDYDDLVKRCKEADVSVPMPVESRRPQINVLGIWPSGVGPELNYQGEIDSIFNAGAMFKYTPLRGPITRQDIVNEYDRKDYKVVQVGSHANEDGIMLSNGDQVAPGWWSRLFFRGNTEIVMLMACHTLGVADSIFNSGIPVIIAVRTEIPDDQVILFTRSFYQQLGSGKTPKDAFYISQLSLTNGYADEVVMRSRN